MTQIWYHQCDKFISNMADHRSATLFIMGRNSLAIYYSRKEGIDIE